MQFRNQREPRPEGLFKKAAIAQWDAQTADLQNAAAEWKKEIEWRDKAFKAASEAREGHDIATAKAAHELEHLQNIQSAALLLERSEAHTREHARLRAKAGVLLSTAMLLVQKP